MRIIICLLIVFFLFTSLSSVYAAVNISIDSYSSSVIIGQEFSISFTANSLSSGTSYYIKGRIGTGSDLDKAETNNTNNSPPDDWLSDNDSWSKFPQITVGDNISTWSGTLKLRAKSAATDGQNSLKVRIKKTTTDTSYDSEAYEITLQPAPTSAPTPTPTAMPVPTSVPTSSPTNNPVLTATPKPQSTPTKYISPTIKLTVSPSPTQDKLEGKVLGEMEETPDSHDNSLSVFLLIFLGGLLFIGAAAAISYKQMKNNKKNV